MRIVTAPADAPIRGTGDKDKDVAPVMMTFEAFVLDVLGNDPRWFSDAEWRNAWDAIVDAVEGTPAGAEYHLEDKYHEKLEQVATQMQIPGRSKVTVRRFVRAITDAPKQPKKKPDGPAKGESPKAEPAPPA